MYKESRIMYFIGMRVNILRLLFMIVMSTLITKKERKTIICNKIVVVNTVVFILSQIFTGFLSVLIIGSFYLLGVMVCLIAF